MKIINIISYLLIISLLLSSCFKDPPEEPYYYPWECNLSVTWNGKDVVITDAQFAFDNRINSFANPNGDSILNIAFRNNQNDPHSEGFSLGLLPDKKNEFIQEYDLNKLSHTWPALSLTFLEWHSPLAEFDLDMNYSNTVEILSISPDKKTITGKLDFRVLISEKSKLAPGQWAPDTITYRNGHFTIKSLE